MTLAPARSRPRVTLPAPRRSITWVLVGGWIAQLAVRLWLFRYHAGPVANPDETGYLIAARWLAGGPGGDFSGSTFYQGGYPLLLVPAFWVTSDPETAYRLVVAIGSMAAASAFPLAYLALRRLRTGRRPALLLAFVAGLCPALVEFAGLALTDAILPTLVLGWLIALHDLAQGRTAGRSGIVAGALAGYATAVHMRGTIVFGVFVVVVAALLLTHRVPRSAGLKALAVAGTVAVAGLALNRAVSAALYHDGVRDLSGMLADRLTSAGGQAWALSGALGQLWYLVTATWGLAGVGMAGATVVALRRGGLPGPRVLAATLLLTTLGIAYASSAALPDEHRVGNYVYGRYTACVAAVWLLAGLVVLLRLRRAAVVRRALAGAGILVAAGGAAAWYAGDRLTTYSFIAFDFPEVNFLTRAWQRLDMIAASAAALSLLACLVAMALWMPRRARLPLVAAGVAAVHLAFLADLAPKTAPAAGPGWLPAPPPGRVALDTRVSWRVWVPLTYQVSWTALERYQGAPPAGACTALTPLAAGPPASGWTATATGSDWVIWAGPACAAKA
ncbi:hypothetical protein ACIBHX_34095 [Nonomuraea sp. NPDC050536]|uniref:hypothetical protein n=1 Tax=Nonomuraea sp. NPDC050536 TaxID=3364366 RepID=UPI0037C67E51